MQDKRSRPAAPTWWRRYGAAMFLTGLLVAAAAVVLTAGYLANETSEAYTGGFDRAQWQEPTLARVVPMLDVPVAAFTATTPSGPVAWTVHADGLVTMRPLTDGVLWPDAQRAFSEWAAGIGQTASFAGLELVDEEGRRVAV